MRGLRELRDDFPELVRRCRRALQFANQMDLADEMTERAFAQETVEDGIQILYRYVRLT